MGILGRYDDESDQICRPAAAWRYDETSEGSDELSRSQDADPESSTSESEEDPEFLGSLGWGLVLGSSLTNCQFNL